MRRASLLAIICVLGLFAGPVLATPCPTISIEYGDGSWQKIYQAGDLQAMGGDAFYLADSASNGTFDAEWEFTFESDPYVISWVSIKNTTSASQTYTVTFTEPVTPAISPSSIYGGSVSGSLTTDPLGGYLSTIAPQPLFVGIIDGIDILPFYPHPSSWSKAGSGTTVIGLQEAWDLAGGAVNNSISIRHTFELGAHDAVALTGYFQVELPEPATIGLLGLGGLVFLKRRRA
ncbi:MAG: PEP-CTERM sorting domain-containing protein [Phycisphaerae bacterium]|nr:PEP-CTERM sorting domain-containing protein [Phycisphaerae bacterium]MDD5380442.1 PEP-CTERM sorting domain-containing protein [Phycisphaerae bacterium]